MKPIMSRRDLVDKEDIWNAVVSVLSDCDLDSKDPVVNEACVVFQYYSELESGGHESLLNWFESYIKEISIDSYIKKLIDTLEKIGAHDYAIIVKNYSQEMWSLYVALKNGENKEDAFYGVIEKADEQYHKLNQKLENLLETYFMRIYTELLEVV
ncbi:hypothetical protein QT711_07970 [Sporosarcina saromensis]|uniref:DNA mimic protein DMP19 C-terminal domain-containing protein n=1 Tax=Sporosarcina saromensis TaxID=359365 RepID=A0ABU4G834_9BACL|nr:hypothetical protein [Sporosarcina saromensis]MDW0113120.1 hypothetical protein [Sporosarcina saromensis]